MNSYSEMRAALNVACAFIASEASAKLKEDAGRIPAKDLKEVNSVCNESKGGKRLRDQPLLGPIKKSRLRSCSACKHWRP
jgi:hypothetical protein